jgi:hypothetical protein
MARFSEENCGKNTGWDKRGWSTRKAIPDCGFQISDLGISLC